MLCIADKAEKLKHKYHTSDPFEICSCYGINVRFADLGKLKGFYKYYMRNRFIVINENLSESMKKLVCAHELGHDVLHREFAKRINLWETTFFDMTSRPELEANIFASEILVEDGDILEAVDNDVSVREIASILCVDENIIKLKLCIMKERGYDLNTDFCTEINFLE